MVDSQVPETLWGQGSFTPFKKVEEFIEIEGIPKEFWPPIIKIYGEKPSPSVSITGGIHGCEYSSIEAALRVGRELEPGDLRGTVSVCPIVNLAAFFFRRAFRNPLDEKNLNRCFPGNPSGSSSERIAHTIVQKLINPADAYIDLHGGDIVEALTPFTIYHPGPSPEVELASKRMALEFSIPLVIRSITTGSTYECAANLGKPAILAEAGQQGILSEEAVRLLKRGVYKVLEFLGVLNPEGAKRLIHQENGEDQKSIRVFLEEEWVKSPQKGLWYPRVSCGDWVKRGDTLGEIRDLFGNFLCAVGAGEEGLIVFLLTSLAVNEGDALLAISHSEEK